MSSHPNREGVDICILVPDNAYDVNLIKYKYYLNSFYLHTQCKKIKSHLKPCKMRINDEDEKILAYDLSVSNEIFSIFVKYIHPDKNNVVLNIRDDIKNQTDDMKYLPGMLKIASMVGADSLLENAVTGIVYLTKQSSLSSILSPELLYVILGIKQFLENVAFVDILPMLYLKTKPDKNKLSKAFLIYMLEYFESNSICC